MTSEEKSEKLLKCPECGKYCTRPITTRVGNYFHTQCEHCGGVLRVDYDLSTK